MKFIAITLVSSTMLVQSIANYCVMFRKYSSFTGTYALLCCDQYNWSFSELISNPEHIKYFSSKCWHFNSLSDIQKSAAGFLSDFIAIRDGQLCLLPLFFSSQQLGEIIDDLYVHILIICTFLSFVQFLSCLFTYYLCWIYELEVRINIIIIIIIIIIKTEYNT